MEAVRDKESPEMCDEESFVILGSTPTPSMECLARSYATETQTGDFSSIPDVPNEPIVTDVKMPSLESTEGAVGGVVAKEESLKSSTASSDAIDSVKVQMEAPKADEATLTPPNFQLNSIVSQASLVSWPTQAPTSLSTNNFNIFSEFPSMKGQNITSSDLSKLENFYCEHNQLKETLLNSNRCLRQYFALAEKWQNEIREFKKQQDAYQVNVLAENERLRGVVEQLEVRLSEKGSGESREALEAQHRQTIEALCEKHRREMQELHEQLVVAKAMHSEEERKSSADAEIKLRQEVEQLEFAMGEKLRVAEMKENQWHQEVAGLTEKYSSDINEVRQRVAQAQAKIASLEEEGRKWHAENDCLKVNLVAAEELNGKLQHDLTEMQQSVEQIEVFKMQAELFERDFEAERAARTVLAGEKEQLLADLRLLQNRHEQLIGEMEGMRHPRSGYPHPESQRTRQFRCPVCSRLFMDLSTLNSHVNGCLDNS